MKYTLSLGQTLSNQEMQDFFELMDEAAGEWLGLEEEDMQEASNISVTFEVPGVAVAVDVLLVLHAPIVLDLAPQVVNYLRSEGRNFRS